jgi:hypothetical protein
MKSRFTSVAVTICLLFFFNGIGICQDKASASDWVDKVGQGNINWSTGYAEAVGIGTLPDNLIRKINARPIAQREAKADALRNLLEIIKSVQLDSVTAIKDFTVENDVVNTQISTLVKGAEAVDYQYLPDGRAEVKMRFPLYGNLARLIMPLAMAKQPGAPALTEASPAPTLKALESPSVPVVVSTGMVIDARGIQARPAMSPRIFDEDGTEVYSLSKVDIEYATKEGVGGYTRDLTAAQTNQRVGANPITVKALGICSPGKSDIIISNADAQKVRSTAVSASFLKQCKVMIVLD